MPDLPFNPSDVSNEKPDDYVVIARRYRPQTFADLVGQDHISKALSGAISTNRVGHAYLFTGARGVGKTSAARIFAKAINCEKGPSPKPCNSCDICRSISTGNDIDVLEIDGASNRGIDEIRQLRQNAGVRPSRSRLKIYIIDEVHMLTREAFNALLKTLEEPPEHVKFIFCTTEPSKLPITILSRCQRFDFAGIGWESVAKQLKRICNSEGVELEPEALELLARRASGSMRDAQSLLEQLLAFTPGKISLSDLHTMLGTANDKLLASLLDQITQRDTAAALEELNKAIGEGVDVGLLLEQLFGTLRDCMVAAAGCPAEALHYASSETLEKTVAAGKTLGLETILAAMQIIDQTISRLRYSTQGRILAELAIVRICELENLDDLASLVLQLQSGGSTGGNTSESVSRPMRVKSSVKPKTSPTSPPPPSVDGRNNVDQKKTDERLPSTPPKEPEPDSETASIPFTPENATKLWSVAAAKSKGMAAEHAKHFEHAAISEPNRLVVTFKAGYTFSKSVCERPDQFTRFEEILAELTGRTVRVVFELREGGQELNRQNDASRTMSPQQRVVQAAKHPMIRKAGELFGAQPLRVDEPPKNQQ